METKNREVSFPINTRIPKDSNVVQLSGAYHYEVFEMGKQFSSNAKIMNANEIISLRNISMHTLEVKDLAFRTVWNYATASSTEYFGLNRKGELTIAWLPDMGPLMKQEFFKNSYSKEISDAGASLGRLPRSVFLDVLDGKFGACYALNFLKLYQETKDSGMEKVLLARIGAYFDAVSFKNAKQYLSNLTTMPISDLCLYMGKFFIDAFGCDSYDLAEKAKIELDSFATVSFIQIGEIKEKGGSFVALSGPCEDCAFLFVMDNNKAHVRKFLPHIAKDTYKSENNLPKCFVTNTNPLEDRHRQIYSFNHWYFTLRETELVAHGYYYGSPEYLVVSMKIVSERRIKNQGITPTLFQIESLVDTEWNFYELQRRRRDKKDFWDITYYQGYVDESRIIPTEAEILASPKLLGRIVGLYNPKERELVFYQLFFINLKVLTITIKYVYRIYFKQKEEVWHAIRLSIGK